jgi:hypothetical protein
LLLAACSANHDALVRGQRYYEDNQYERALAVWRDLARHETSLTASERARYAYLRGMTDYRLGFRDEARHWLAMAKTAERRHPRSMEPEWLLRLDAALGDLDREVFGIRSDGADPVQSIEAPANPIEAPAPSLDPPARSPLLAPSLQQSLRGFPARPWPGRPGPS